MTSANLESLLKSLEELLNKGHISYFASNFRLAFPSNHGITLYSESEFAINFLNEQCLRRLKWVGKLEEAFSDTLYERFLKEFMDVLIMVKIREAEASGYDLLTYFHKEFDLLVSPGTVYSVLYFMERNELIKARRKDRKRLYSLTAKGENAIKSIKGSGDALEKFFSRLLKHKMTKAYPAPCKSDFSPLVDIATTLKRE